MQVFKYTLDKGTKKFLCPNCSKKTFVLYVDNETGDYLNNEFGRCDREQNCSYHKAPPKGKKGFLIKALSIKSISDKAYRLIDEFGIVAIVPKSQILEQTKNDCWISEWFLKTSFINYFNSDTKYFNDEGCLKNVVLNNISLSVRACKVNSSFHSLDLLNEMYLENPTIDNLTEYLKLRFPIDKVTEAIQRYFITGTNHFWSNATAFWQINEKERIHACKIMQYDRFTGKRIKEPYNRINWLHKVINAPDFNLKQCLFGLHRINEDYQKTIAIVESEKTAIIMSILLPHYIWLATGSKVNFKFEILKPIKKRNIVSFPDKGEYNNWLDKAAELNAIGFKIGVSDLIEQTDFENGFDLADYYFNF